SYASLHYPFLLSHPDHPRAAECIRNALDEVYCLHFAGSVGEMARVTGRGMAGPAAATARRAAIAEGDGAAQLDAAGALMTFARPDPTARVFEATRRARPGRLFVVADGPRPGHDGDAAACEAARAVTERVDWDCDVRRHYADANLGVKRRIVTGLDWVFDQVEEAIVVEDDCMPHPTFFRFCDELLARHRETEQVMTIGGNN